MEAIIAALKSEMTYPSSLIAETLNYKGYTIKIQQDLNATNPYNFDEGMTPALWFYDRDFNDYAPELHSPFDYYTDNQISRHWRKICSILNLDEAEHEQEVKDAQENWPDPTGQVRKAIFADYLAESKPGYWGSATTYLEQLAELYNLIKIPAYTFQRNGYSQGDCVYGLIVYTPEFIEKTGVKPSEKDAKDQADDYGAWVWGNCYGFEIEELDDSVWGYIGSNPDHILSDIAWHIQQDLRRKRDRLKTLIRNRVPLEVRRDFVNNNQL